MSSRLSSRRASARSTSKPARASCATSWWFTELYAKWHHEPGAPSAFDAWEWENKFQLTETGKYPVDVGFLLEIERPKDRSEGYEYKWGPLLQSEFGLWQANLNLLI